MPEPQLRPAEEHDCDAVFDWANDPDTRAASFLRADIVKSDHIKWFKATLAGKLRQLFIILSAGQRAGVVRFDWLADADAPAGAGRCAEVGINLAPSHRGRRLSTPALHAATVVARDSGVGLLIAHIHPDNLSSVRAFESADYRLVDTVEIKGSHALRYELRLAEISV